MDCAVSRLMAGASGIIPDPPSPDQDSGQSGTIRRLSGIFECPWSFKDHHPVTTRYPYGPTRTITDSPGSNTKSTRRKRGLSRNNTAEIRIAPDKHGPRRHLHGTYSRQRHG
ncbi:hypothetical protein DPMN_091130 [Dreissena polymorpha]|uniref:Uncharacterized protein n=1 Tax=Dreissena polymorpha TaxID=45954 RepID=A0A9D4KZ10_DREPO|nr:hypothetical protein DPMN_091130 [Dreissena polymorpha]